MSMASAWAEWEGDNGEYLLHDQYDTNHFAEPCIRNNTDVLQDFISI